MRNTLAVLAALALAACGGGAPPAADDPAAPATPEVSAEERALRQLAADFAAAWNAGDAGALMEGFAEEADLVDPRGGYHADRAAIQKNYEELFAGMYAGTTISIEVETVRMLDGAALLSGSYRVTGMTGPEGAELPAHGGRFLNVAVGSGESWSVAASRPWVPLTPPAPGA